MVASGGADGGTLAPQFLAKQLTLSQPGGQIMPTTVLQAPQISRPCDGPVLSTYLLTKTLEKYDRPLSFSKKKDISVR